MQSLRCLLTTLCLLVSTFAWAQGGANDPDAQARGYYQSGLVHYEAGRYAVAHESFQKGYDLTKKPGFLWNMAECQRSLGANSAAIDLYERYLKESPPNAPQRPDAERLVKELKKPVVPAPSAAASIPAPQASAQPAPGPRVDMLPPSRILSEPPKHGSQPVTKKWWFWTGAGAAVVTTVVVAVLASQGGGNNHSGGSAPPSGTYTVDWR